MHLPPHPDSNARLPAARIVRRWLETGAFPNRLLDAVLERRGFVTELVCGAVRWKRALDWVVAAATRRAPEPGPQAFLLVGLYQVLFMDAVADYAAVHETVAAARAELGARQAGFINALLRRAARERPALRAGLARQPPGIRLSHPDLLVERWQRRLGASRMEALCDWNNRRPDTIARVNRLVADPDYFLRALERAGLAGQVAPGPDPDSFVLAHGLRVEELPGYAEGRFLVMDPAAARAVDLLDPRPGDRVLDACAAPGGKTALIAARLRRAGRLEALDARADRLTRLRANLARLGCAASVEVRQGDARRLNPPTGPGYDRVLLDVPCSNTGVIRRKPDVRWRFSGPRLARLAAVQRKLLTRAAAAVRPGGVLVYSTCSLEAEENEGLVAGWLAGRPEFRLDCAWQSVPPAGGMDGAYAARLVRE